MSDASSLPALIAWGLSIGGLLFGMWLLTRSADWFVDGAVGLAFRLRMPPLIVGFVIVGFGTSAPEMLVSVLAAAQGLPLLSLGNAYGSNITNVLLILGASMLIAPIALHRVALRRDIPFLLLTTLFIVGLALFGSLTRLHGAILVAAFILFLAWQIFQAMKKREATPCEGAQEVAPLGRSLFLTLGGLGALLAASQILVMSARFIAERAAAAAGMSPEATQLIIGITVVALGTSLPELMASITAMRKGQHDIALGNVVGSNCFNLCIVAGLALLIHPVSEDTMPYAFRYRDGLIMLATTLTLWVGGLLAWLRVHGKKRDVTLGRKWGISFLVAWLLYTLWVFTHTAN